MKILTEFYKEYLDLYPSIGSFLGHRQYDNQQENFLSKRVADNKKSLLKRYLEKTERNNNKDLALQTFTWYLRNEMKSFNNLWLLPITSFDNIITSTIFANKRFYSINTPRDVSNLISRYNDMITIIKTCKAVMKEGIRRGVIIPKRICSVLLTDLKEFCKSKSYIIQVKDELMMDGYTTTLTHYEMALQHLIEFIEDVYLPRCLTTLGICYLPSGKSNYKQLVVSSTTLSITPEEVYNLGIEEVKRIQGEFMRNRDSLGYSNLSYLDFCHKIINDPKNYANSVKDILEIYKKQRTRIRQWTIHKYFKKGIKKTYDIRPIPKDIEGSSPAAFYNAGNYTNQSKGTFYVNTRDLKANSLYSTYVLSLHEGEPGHHYQFQHMIESKVPEYSVFAFNSNGFVEGWALYVENLGDYEPIEYFGKLTYEMLRAVRCVVDVGIHYYGWTWEKALKYMQTHIPMKTSELKSELLRYICIPGQAVAYKVGERFFLQLREAFLKANPEKGIKDFHEEVLKYGVIPLEILKQHFKSHHKISL